jgi:hypothetical protein
LRPTGCCMQCTMAVNSFVGNSLFLFPHQGKFIMTTILRLTVHLSNFIFLSFCYCSFYEHCINYPSSVTHFPSSTPQNFRAETNHSSPDERRRLTM